MTGKDAVRGAVIQFIVAKFHGELIAAPLQKERPYKEYVMDEVAVLSKDAKDMIERFVIMCRERDCMGPMKDPIRSLFRAPKDHATLSADVWARLAASKGRRPTSPRVPAHGLCGGGDPEASHNSSACAGHQSGGHLATSKSRADDESQRLSTKMEQISQCISRIEAMRAKRALKIRQLASCLGGLQEN